MTSTPSGSTRRDTSAAAATITSTITSITTTPTTTIPTTAIVTPIGFGNTTRAGMPAAHRTAHPCTAVAAAGGG
jgi:hypothetical protein